MIRALIIAPILIAALLAACSGDSPEPEPTAPPATATATAPTAATARGTFVLTRSIKGYADPKKYVVGNTCAGSGGYVDIAGGMEVTLLQDGKIVELARLSAGTITKSVSIGNYARLDYECTFTFEITVPPDGEFFVLKMGRRGEQTFRRDELLAPGLLAFTIGD